jgi:ParB family chromosome partitioning protein
MRLTKMIQTKEVPLDSISLDSDFTRGQYDTTKYADLKESIKQKGIIYPLIAIETTDGLLLIAGYRRYQAAKELGLPSVPCYCLKIGMDDAEIMRLHENLFREEITPLQEALAFSRLEHTYHFSREKISKLIGKSKSYVTQKIQILDWQPFLRTALERGDISYSIARELSVVTDDNECMRLLSTCITSGATVRTVLLWIQDWRTAKAHLALETEKSNANLLDKTNQSNQTTCHFCGSTPINGELKSYLICTNCAAELFPNAEQPQSNDAK